MSRLRVAVSWPPFPPPARRRQRFPDSTPKLSAYALGSLRPGLEVDSNLRRVEFRATWHRVRYQSVLWKCCPDALSIRLKGYHVDEDPSAAEVVDQQLLLLQHGQDDQRLVVRDVAPFDQVRRLKGLAFRSQHRKLSDHQVKVLARDAVLVGRAVAAWTDLYELVS